MSSFPEGNSVWELVTDGKNVYFGASGSSSYIGYAPVGGIKQAAKVLARTSDETDVAAAAGKVFWIDGTAIWGIAAP